MSFPTELKYTKDHEWIRAEGNEAYIGITEFAQQELGDIVYVDLPKPGAVIKQGTTIGSVESVKAVSDIYTPVSGEVVEVNGLLTESPETLNKDPYGTGWLVKIKLSEPGEVAKLLTAAEYQAFVGTESS